MPEKLRKVLKEKHPLIHCITNPISINQCANAILAVGARPMMAEHPAEVSVITGNAGAVLLNLGNLTDVRMESMRISASEAEKKGIPFVLDVCGAACLSNRRDYSMELIGAHCPSVIKGNYSEVRALCDPAYRASGVDAEAVSGSEAIRAARMLAEKYHTTVLASGKTDIVTNGEKVILCHNGTAQLATITGTGCMQGAICAAFLAAADTAMEAAVAATVMLGVCGELAETEKGSGSFGVNLLDALSTVSDAEILARKQIEEGTFDE